MTVIGSAIHVAERAPLPDFAFRFGIEALVERTKWRLAEPGSAAEERFAREMSAYAIAEHPDSANRQHYELPPEFFSLTLGPRRKYSCCFYENETTGLADAELRSLEKTIAHADLHDGQDILELGCGWGSLTFYMAETLPHSKVTAVSNSRAQGDYITREAARRGLQNLRVITCDMNDFSSACLFDRVVSVEMFEHISNWRALLTRIRSWLSPTGRLFIHIFSHKAHPYRFDASDKSDWIAQHFFTGGIMPSHGLVGRFPDLFTVDRDWRWNGRHYQRTALDWLANFDANQQQIAAILGDVYGRDAALWRRRWRLFYLATAGLFGHGNGDEWAVSHFLLRPSWAT